MRSLIDMAADRGAFIDQSQSLNLFVESPNIGQLSSMYFHAWKHGLKTTYYLRSRPATRIAKATVETAPRRQGRGRRRLLARKPRELRGLPMSDLVEPPSTPARSRALPDPASDGLPGLLRDVPDGHQEHLDGRGGRLRDRRRRPADEDDATPSATWSSGWWPSSPPATRSSANNLVLSLYKHLNSPEARMYLSRQLYEEALHVQFYLTLLDTYVPDPARAARAPSPRSRTSRRSARRRTFCLRWMDSIAGARAAGDARAPAAVPAQPDLLRRLHRGAVLLRRLRLRLLPALARPAARPGRRDQLGVPRRERAHGVRLRGGATPCAARSRSCSTTSSTPRSRP